MDKNATNFVTGPEERLSKNFRTRFARITLEQHFCTVEGVTLTFLSIAFFVNLAPVPTLYAFNPPTLYPRWIYLFLVWTAMSGLIAHYLYKNRD